MTSAAEINMKPVSAPLMAGAAAGAGVGAVAAVAGGGDTSCAPTPVEKARTARATPTPTTPNVRRLRFIADISHAIGAVSKGARSRQMLPEPRVGCGGVSKRRDEIGTTRLNSVRILHARMVPVPPARRLQPS